MSQPISPTSQAASFPQGTNPAGKNKILVIQNNGIISRDLKVITGLIVGLVGLFISLAAFQVFPRDSNVISEMGEGFKYVGCIVTIGSFIFALEQLYPSNLNKR